MNRYTFNTLCLTPKAYELKVFDLYYDWCLTYGYTDKEVQILLITDKAFQYFLTQLRSLEAEFDSLISLSNYGNLSAENKLRFYDKITRKVLKHYPKSILNDVRRTIKKEADRNTPK